jgi:hypothetical protein
MALRVVIRCLALCLALLVADQSVAAVKPQSRFASTDDIMRWMNLYRTKPDPWRLPKVIRTMAEMGLFNDQETSLAHVGFIAGVLSANQLKARAMIKSLEPMRPDEQVIMIKAVAHSGLPDWQVLLADIGDKASNRRVLINRYLSGEAKRLMELPLDTGSTLDVLWGFYLATGSYEPVLRIIQALPQSNDREDVDKLVVGSMAKWTLANNATRDPALMDLYRTEITHSPETIAKPLKEIVDAVDIAETGAIKKQAFKAIEELKVKGPESKRNYTWASRIGSTTLALGCVVASALGQAEIGIPCVIGGALTSAAERYLTAP